MMSVISHIRHFAGWALPILLVFYNGRPPLPPRGVACLHYRSVPKCRAFGKKIWSKRMHCLPPASLSVLPYAHEAFACLLAYDIHPRRQSFPRRNAQGDSAWIVLLSRRVWKSPALGISSPLHSEDIRQRHRHLLAFYGSPLAPRYAQSVYTRAIIRLVHWL